MTRLYGRAATNERVNDYVTDVRFERTSIIGTMGLNGIDAPMTFKGTLNGEFFKGYVDLVLAPTLEAGDIVILDNLSSHKVDGVLDEIYEKGASVLFLPEYSLDLNPIELMWSKLKSVLRKLKPRTIEELEDAISIALESVSNSDIVGWFEHDGYCAG
jgi:transposase